MTGEDLSAALAMFGASCLREAGVDEWRSGEVLQEVGNAWSIRPPELPTHDMEEAWFIRLKFLVRMEVGR